MISEDKTAITQYNGLNANTLNYVGELNKPIDND